MNKIILLVIAVLGIGAAAGAKPSTSPRLHQLFDANWRFYRGEAAGASAEGFNDSGWRQVDLPHDFSIEDLPSISLAGQPALVVTPGLWRFKLGDDPTWKNPDLDDSGWDQVQLPAGWRSYINGNITNTYGWYRRRIEVPAAMRGKDLLLLPGKIDDVDETFVNGVKIGGLGSFPPNYSTAWEISRRYTVPAHLLKGDGTDVVAVRVYNGEGDGGIYAISTTPQQSGPFDSESEGGTAQGYTLGGVGWYRKTFTLPASLRGRRLEIAFDGVYMDSQVWLNGQSLGRHPYGYTSFYFDMTPHARFGAQPNLLAVRVDSSGRTSRWYSGSGIYRHVWLTAANPVHIAHWGVFVTTPQVTDQKATVHVRATVQNSAPKNQPVTLELRVLDSHGSTAAQGKIRQAVQAGGNHDLEADLVVNHPELWSPDSPARYRLVSTVTAGGKIADEMQTPFGIRSIAFSAVNGFTLNGKPLKLRGGCVHHDNGYLGSCTYDRAEERRVALLKAAGFNAIRTSHNPPSPGFLDACDRLGMIVMDESFDCWRHGKNSQDYGRFFDKWWKQDLDSMVLRDRNHPSVVLWSIGNEIPEQHTPEGAQTAAMLASEVRSLDPTRPVAQATNPDANKLDPLLEHLDVTGYNYASGRYAGDHQQHPDRIFAGTESTPQGCFDQWMATIDHPYVIGDFVWTALDYLGEAGIGKTVPQTIPPGYVDNRLWTVSNCGDLDLDGFQRPQSYYRNAVWGVGARISCFVQAPGPDGKPERVEGWGWPDERPSWTWPGLEGKPLTIRVYSSYPRVRLLLNGRDLGMRDTNRATRFTATWDVPYTPGELAAVGLDSQGKEAVRWTLRTAGKPTTLHLTPDRAAITANGEDLSYVTVEVRDANGLLDPNAASLVHFTLTGPGKIIAVGNADPRSTESFQQPQRSAFRGRCLIVIKAGEQPGQVQLRAEAEGLTAAETMITTQAISELER